jgi:hypothetical protein
MDARRNEDKEQERAVKRNKKCQTRVLTREKTRVRLVSFSSAFSSRVALSKSHDPELLVRLG